MPGQVGANIQKVFAYGLRNSFGMAFDPDSGTPWEQENGDDSFSELNIAEPVSTPAGSRSAMAAERIAQFKAIETDPTAPQPFAAMGTSASSRSAGRRRTSRTRPPRASRGSSCCRAPTTALRDELGDGRSGWDRLPLQRALLALVPRRPVRGGARTFLEGGHLFHLNLTGNRRSIGVDDLGSDRVADNINKWELTESESLLFSATSAS